MSQNQEINDVDDSYDQSQLQAIKQQICLSNAQLLELTYNDQKFYKKLSEFNKQGCQCIAQLKYHEALIYLGQAEKVLQYAASCGKTIQRNLIITTLNNQAALYQRAWELEKASSYIEAIIYNISSFFDGEKQFQFTNKILDEESHEFEDFGIYLWRKKSLALYYLQFCAINSQNKNHQNAFKSAQKAVNLIKQVCKDCFRFQGYSFRGTNQGHIGQVSLVKPYKKLLGQLGHMKALQQTQMDFQKYYNQAIHHIAVYIKRMKQNGRYLDQAEFQDYKNSFSEYSIGHLMQINAMQLKQQSDRLILKDQISVKNKFFKAIYLSIGHFILATELRFISTEKYTLDENQRRNSLQYKESQIYHLVSIIIVAKFLPCQSVYFEHIVNSFRSHYKIDIMEDGRKFLEEQPQKVAEELLQELSKVIENQQNQYTCEKTNPFQNQIVANIAEEIKFDNQYQPTEPQAYQTAEQSDKITVKHKKNSEQEIPQSPLMIKKSRPLGHTASKKSRKKIMSKSQLRLQTNYEDNKLLVDKEYKRTINQLTSKQKQNRQMKVKSSRSRKKSQFMSKKKLKLNVGKHLAQNKNQAKFDPEQYYGKHINKSRSKSKSKRISMYVQNQKLPRRKDSCADIRKIKKTDQQYGTGNIKANQEAKASRNNLALKKSKHTAQVSERNFKCTSPQIKIKKMKSPKNTKKLA